MSTPQPDDFVEWIEPWGPSQKQNLINRMTVADVLAYRREIVPRYAGQDDSLVLDDFLVVYWAKIVPKEST